MTFRIQIQRPKIHITAYTVYPDHDIILFCGAV